MPESLQWWFIKNISCHAILANDLEIPLDGFLGNEVTVVKVGDQRYSIICDVASSVTLQIFSP